VHFSPLLAIARSHEQFDADGQLIAAQLRVRLGTLIAALADATKRQATGRQPRTCPLVRPKVKR